MDTTRADCRRITARTLHSGQLAVRGKIIGTLSAATCGVWGCTARELIRLVRLCKTAAEERAAVAKECAAIRTAFKRNVRRPAL